MELDPAAGARVTSLVIVGQEVIPGRLVEGEEHDWYRGIFPLAPWAGNLAGGAFSFEGKEYHVASEKTGRAMHGLLAETPWQIHHQTGSEAVLGVAFGPEQGHRWPFPGEAALHYRLDDNSLSMRLTVRSLTGRMPTVAGFHPWFRSAIGGATALVSFTPAGRLLLDPATGRRTHTSDLGSRPWDDLFVDVPDHPRITWPGGPSLTLSSNGAVWVYYERTPGGFCIEPWTGSDDALGTGQAAVVTPTEPLVLDFTITWAPAKSD